METRITAQRPDGTTIHPFEMIERCAEDMLDLQAEFEYRALLRKIAANLPKAAREGGKTMATKTFEAEDVANEIASVLMCPTLSDGGPRLFFGDVLIAWSDGEHVSLELKDGTVFVIDVREVGRNYK